MKRTFKQQIIYLLSPQFSTDVILSVVENKIFGVFLFITLMGLPVFILLTPQYWTFFFQYPRFFITSFICFFVPYLFFASYKYLRNPFFILPFTVSFVLSSQMPIYAKFLEIYLIFIGIAIQNLVRTRTKPPHIYTDVALERTTAFTWYGEARIFWEIVLRISVPVFLVICIVLRYFI